MSKIFIPTALAALFLFLLSAVTAGAEPLEREATPSIGPSPAPQICNFSGYIDHALVTSWELQLDVPSDKCQGLSLPEMLQNVETVLLQLSTNQSMGFHLSPESLRTSVFDQVSYAVATLDGRPLVGRGNSTKFPWHGPAFIRYRRKYESWRAPPSGPPEAHLNATLDALNQPFGVLPGSGDLTLKVKDVDLDKFEPLHKLLHFPPKAERRCGHRKSYKRPHLKWKVENDRYCAEGRPTYEAMYRPVVLKDGIHTRKSTTACFPELWEYLGLEAVPRLDLPLYNKRSFTKSVWDVEVNNVPGVLNWVATYPSLLDALTALYAGPTAAECELSIRLKRQCAEERGKDVLISALDKVASMAETLHALGWDTGVH